MNHYEILGVPETATNSEILAAYRKLIAEFSPSQVNGIEGPINDIQEAWDTLKDDKLKAEYDNGLKWSRQKRDEVFRDSTSHVNKYDTSIQYAGFWIRFCAWFIDWIIVWVLVFFVGYLLASIDPTLFDSSDIDTIATLIAIIVSWLYYAIMEASAKQGTLGKLAVGIKVVDNKFQRPTFGRATGRFFGKFLSSIFFGLGFIAVGFDSKKQSWHDSLSASFVIYR
jgi:uncharacterized RDD family membrane protein YckC